MKTIIYLFFLGLLLSSCGAYRYHSPAPNPALFQHEGEVQISGNVGSSGLSLKGGFSLPGHIGVIGMYHSSPFEYRSREGELGIGFYSNADPRGVFVVGGLGFGSNYEYTNNNYSTKKYEGDFLKPFVQFNGGITGGTIIGGLKGDIVGILKANYLIYDGKHLDGSEDKIKSDFVLIEPGVTMSLGSRVFKFDITTSFPIHPTFEDVDKRANARTFPATIGFGFRLVFGRDKETDIVD